MQSYLVSPFPCRSALYPHRLAIPVFYGYTVFRSPSLTVGDSDSVFPKSKWYSFIIMIWRKESIEKMHFQYLKCIFFISVTKKLYRLNLPVVRFHFFDCPPGSHKITRPKRQLIEHILYCIVYTISHIRFTSKQWAISILRPKIGHMTRAIQGMIDCIDHTRIIACRVFS